MFHRTYIAKSLILALFVPSQIAIWYRTQTSRRIVAVFLGPVFGGSVWALEWVMIFTGQITNPLVGSIITTTSIAASGTIAFLICHKSKRLPKNSSNPD